MDTKTIILYILLMDLTSLIQFGNCYAIANSNMEEITKLSLHNANVNVVKRLAKTIAEITAQKPQEITKKTEQTPNIKSGSGFTTQTQRHQSSSLKLIPNKKTQSTPKEKKDVIPRQGPKHIIDEVPQVISGKPQFTLQKDSQPIPHKMPQHNPGKIPRYITGKGPQMISDKIMKHTSGESSGKESKPGSGHPPQIVSGHVSQTGPGEMPKLTPGKGIPGISREGMQNISGKWAEKGTPVNSEQRLALNPRYGMQLLRDKRQHSLGNVPELIPGDMSHLFDSQGVELIPGTGPPVASGQGLELIPGTGPPVLSGQGLELIPGTGPPVLSGQGLELIPGTGPSVVSGQGIELIPGAGPQLVPDQRPQLIPGIVPLYGFEVVPIKGTIIPGFLGLPSQCWVRGGLQWVPRLRFMPEEFWIPKLHWVKEQHWVPGILCPIEETRNVTQAEKKEDIEPTECYCQKNITKLSELLQLFN